MVSDVLEQYDVVITFICYLYPRKTNSNEYFRRIFKHRALPLRIMHRTELYLSLVGKNCGAFFVAFRKYFSVCSGDIYYTICFNCFKQLNLSRYKAVRSTAYPQNVVDLLGFQSQRRFVNYQIFQ